MARWTAARRRAHAARIRALRALGPDGPYKNQPAKLAQAHRAGIHPGFGQRSRISEEERKQRAREATRRYRARKAGKAYESGWPSVAASSTEAAAVADRSAGTTGFQGLARLTVRKVEPTDILWDPRTPVETTTDGDIDPDLRMRGYKAVGTATGFESVHGHRWNEAS
jgi:hypothetical protein